MRREARWPGVAGALFGAGGVALAAYAAHGATGDAQRWLYTAAAMALVHGAFLAAALPRASRLATVARVAMVAGLVLFCGSLVGAHALGLPTKLAPAGGALLIGSWLLVAIERSRN